MDAIDESLSVTVYSTGSHCQRCRLTRVRLEALHVPYLEVDLSDDANAAAREFVTDDLGYAEAPVVVVNGDPQNHWSGFRPDLIDRLAAHRDRFLKAPLRARRETAGAQFEPAAASSAPHTAVGLS